MLIKRIFAALVLPITLSAQVLLTDDFSGGSLETTKWTTILPNSSSSVIQSAGVITTTARGILGSVTSFTAPFSVSGSFTMLSELEHFNVVVRSDLSAGDFGERRGIFASFTNDGNQISLQRYNSAVDWDLLDLKSYTLTTGQQYSFELIDYGSTVTLAINGVLELTGTSSYSTGDHIGFYSREFSNTATAIDAVTVSRVQTSVPDTGHSAVLLCLALLTLAYSGRNARASSVP